MTYIPQRHHEIEFISRTYTVVLEYLGVQVLVPGTVVQYKYESRNQLRVLIIVASILDVSPKLHDTIKNRSFIDKTIKTQNNLSKRCSCGLPR